MAGILGLVNLLGSPAADRLSTGIGAERDVGVPEGRTTVLVVRDDCPATGRIGVATAASNGDGHYLQEIGSTGVFTGRIAGDIYQIAEDVRNTYRAAGANVPANWSTAGASHAVLGAHGGNATRFNQGAEAAALNLTIQQWASSAELFPSGIGKTVPDLTTNLTAFNPTIDPGAWTFRTIDRANSLTIGVES